MKVIIICGGNSLEKEVSVKTGISVHTSLKKTFDTELLFLGDDYSKVKSIYERGDIVFNALHGGYGENGEIQSFFEEEEISFIGSGSKACRLAMSKNSCKTLAQSLNIQTPYGKKIKEDDLIFNEFEKPFVIKPDQEGSSVGFFKINTEKEMLKAIKENKKITNQIIAEEFVQGREITVPILDNKALPIVEITPKHENYDYECKYTQGMSKYSVPAKIDKNIENKIKEDSLRIFKEIGADHYSRIDYILVDDIPYFLEINTYPGMTKMSLFPMSSNSLGVDFDNLMINLVELGLKSD